MEPSRKKSTRNRLFLLIGCGLLLVSIGFIWQIVATDKLTRWKAERLSNESLATAAAKQDAPIPFVLEWAKRLEADARSAEAERVYARAMEIAPSNAEAWIGFGRTAFVNGDWGKADAVLAKAVELWPDNTNAHFTYASILGSTFRVRKAIEQLKAGLKSNPTKAEALETLGDMEMRESNPVAAADAYGNAKNLLPTKPGLLDKYGAALVEAGKYEQAKTVIEAAVKQDPSDMNARFNLGKALGNSGKDQDRPLALQELTRVVGFSANKSRAYVEAARIWLRQGDRGNAIQALEHAFDLNPYNIEMLTLLTQAYLDDGRRADAEKARKALEHAQRLTGARKQILAQIDEEEHVVGDLIRLGQVDLEGENVIEAQIAFRAASFLEPNNADAKHGLKIIAEKTRH